MALNIALMQRNVQRKEKTDYFRNCQFLHSHVDINGRIVNKFQGYFKREKIKYPKDKSRIREESVNESCR